MRPEQRTKISDLLSAGIPEDKNGHSIWINALHIELLREKMTEVQERLRSLERNEKSNHGQWPIVQAIFIAISFIAATVALLKAFGLLQLPWLH